MKDLIDLSTVYRAYADWKKVLPSMDRPEDLIRVAENLQGKLKQLRATYKEARAIIAAYPGTEGARVLSEMLAVGEEKKALALKANIVAALKKQVIAARKVIDARPRAKTIPEAQRIALYDSPQYIGRPEAAAIVKSNQPIASVSLPGKNLKFSPIRPLGNNESRKFDIRQVYNADIPDGLVYARCRATIRKSAAGSLCVGADGPFKAFLNGQELVCVPDATNPIDHHIRIVPAIWKKGENEVVMAIRTNGGQAYGFMAEAILK